MLLDLEPSRHGDSTLFQSYRTAISLTYFRASYTKFRLVHTWAWVVVGGTQRSSFCRSDFPSRRCRLSRFIWRIICASTWTIHNIFVGFSNSRAWAKPVLWSRRFIKGWWFVSTWPRSISSFLRWVIRLSAQTNTSRCSFLSEVIFCSVLTWSWWSICSSFWCSSCCTKAPTLSLLLCWLVIRFVCSWSWWAVLHLSSTFFSAKTVSSSLEGTPWVICSWSRNFSIMWDSVSASKAPSLTRLDALHGICSWSWTLLQVLKIGIALCPHVVRWTLLLCDFVFVSIRSWTRATALCRFSTFATTHSCKLYAYDQPGARLTEEAVFGLYQPGPGLAAPADWGLPTIG